MIERQRMRKTRSIFHRISGVVLPVNDVESHLLEIYEDVEIACCRGNSQNKEIAKTDLMAK